MAQRNPVFRLAEEHSGNFVQEYGQHLTRKTKHEQRRKRKRKRALNAPQTLIDYAVPDSKPGLLRELSRKGLCAEPLSIVSYALIVTREAESAAREGKLPDGTDMGDLQRLSRQIDDFVLEHRDATDTQKRMALWTAQCKLIDLMYNVLLLLSPPGHDNSAATSSTATHVREPLRVKAGTLTNSELAQWMHDNDTCDPSVLHYTDADRAWHHTLLDCGVEALWSSIRSLMQRWPQLQFDEHVFAQFDVLRQRTAFFLSYRELIDDWQRVKNKQRRREVLGLSLDRWKVRAAVPISDDAANDQDIDFRGFSNDGIGRETPAKLNSVEFTRVVTDVDGNSFACINEDFIEETERVLNSMLLQLRRYCGFEWHVQLSDTEQDCLACEWLVENPYTASAERRLQQLVEEQLTGPFRDFAAKDFRENLFELFEQPGERELFGTYNPYDKNTAQNFISRMRRADSRTYNRRYMDPQLVDVWHDLCTGDETTNPVYGLIGSIATSYYMQVNLNGAQLGPYCVDTAAGEPFTLKRERFRETRNCKQDLYTDLVTTGTLRMRHKMMPRLGLNVPNRDRFYEHPLIVKVMGSFCVLQNERMHLCTGGFGQAFCAWLAIMCNDNELCGELHTGASLFDLYALLFAENADKIRKQQQRVQSMCKRWNPLTRMMNADKLQYRSGSGRANSASTHEAAGAMLESQF